MQKVQDLLMKLPREMSAKAGAIGIPGPGQSVETDAQALAAQKLNAEVGTKLAEGRRLQETDPDKAVALYEDTLKAIKASDIAEPLARTMARRMEVAIELARKDKIAFDAKMKDKTERAEIEAKAKVTERIRPLRLGGGRVIHQVALPWHWGYTRSSEDGVIGDSTNDLGALSGDPNTSIQESKAFTCNVRAGRREGASTARLAGVRRGDGDAAVNQDHDAEELPRP